MVNLLRVRHSISHRRLGEMSWFSLFPSDQPECLGKSCTLNAARAAQSDIHSSGATVHEALLFSAKLRLNSRSKAQIQEYVTEVGLYP